MLDSLRRLVGYDRVEIDSAAHIVRLPVRGMMLDFGGIAKGYALDLARAALSDKAILGGTVDLGGNVLAFGRPPSGRRWRIGVAHPRRDGRIVGTVAIDSGAVATSGDYEHYFIVDGIRYGHLIDPTTGYPRRGVIAATAIGPRGELSDGMSGVLFLAGVARGRAIADSLPGIAGIWIADVKRREVRRSDIALSRRARRLFVSRLH
jgi:thiamine biosynthesis lipoprotein